MRQLQVFCSFPAAKASGTPYEIKHSFDCMSAWYPSVSILATYWHVRYLERTTCTTSSYPRLQYASVTFFVRQHVSSCELQDSQRIQWTKQALCQRLNRPSWSGLCYLGICEESSPRNPSCHWGKVSKQSLFPNLSPFSWELAEYEIASCRIDWRF